MNPSEDPVVTINGFILRDIWRRRRATVLGTGVAVLLGLNALQLLVLPQTYSATVSIAVQQPSASGSGLALLTGQTPSKKYLGMIRSRLLANVVEKSVHLQQLYALPTHNKALEMLMDSVKVDDNANDGLLFVTVNLPGPPAWLPASARRSRVKKAAMDAANTYQVALSDYFANYDNDHDAVIWRNAQTYQQQARRDFDLASANVRSFVNGLRLTSMAEAPALTSESAASLPNGLETLLTKEAEIDGQLSGALAERTARQQGVASQLADPSHIPADDPLLMDARHNVIVAKAELDRISLTYGQDAPRYHRAEGNLRIAQETLRQQMQGIRGRKSTLDINFSQKIEGLRAQKNRLHAEIEQRLSKLPLRSRTTTTLEELRIEQQLALKKLEATETKVAELELSSVSGKSRFLPVDQAIWPEHGSPGPIRATLLSLFAALCLMGAMLFRDYVRGLRRVPALPDTLYSTSTTAAAPEAVIASPLAPHGANAPANGGQGNNGDGHGNGSTPKTRRRPRP